MATQGIDFSQLSTQDALDLAILIEEEAEERYQELAHQMDLHHTPDAAGFFRLMAGNEARHGEQLARRRTEQFGAAPRRVTRGMLWDVEAPDYDEARAFMSPRRAMETALRCEEKAHAFFAGALGAIRDPAARALFEDLRDEETCHQELVGRELAKLPPETEPEIDPEDFTDEPTSQ
jgi:erythrin-vacuolar iron transport family protein